MSTHTRIQVTIDWPGSSYGPEWTIGAIEKQAKEEALQGVANLLQQHKPSAVVVGRPVVTTIIVSSDKP